MNLFVGNLDFRTSEDELTEVFSEYGALISIKLIVDRETGRSKGYAFVEMEDADGQKAIDALNNFQMGERNISVSEARPREERPRSNGGGFGGNNRGGGGGSRGGSGGGFNRGGNNGGYGDFKKRY
jgi:RNA recognition motif-containing protein